MENPPLVSVICVSHNHARFIEETINSVLDQSYRNFELIIIDDCSSDHSPQIIKDFVKKNPTIKFLLIKEPIGYTKAFNLGFQVATGKYIIDLATDDVLLPDRLNLQVEAFEKLNDNYGIVFTDAVYIDEQSNILYNHYKRDKTGKLLEKIPSGDIYKDVLERYFICTPTMMFSKRMLDKLGGYDEDLEYEDFDIWVRGGRTFKFHYLDHILTGKRNVKGSMSSGWYKKGDRQLLSTLKVCEKAIQFENTPEELKSLKIRVLFEIRQAIFSENRKEAKLFYEFLKKIEKPSLLYKVLLLVNDLRLPLAGIRRLYHYFLKRFR